MEKRQVGSRETKAFPSTVRSVASDAESSVSTRSSSSTSSASSWKPKHRRVKTQRSLHTDTRVSSDRFQPLADANNTENKFVYRLHAIVTAPEAQLLIIALIALDLCGTGIELYLHSQHQLARAWHQLEHKDAGAPLSSEVSASLLVRLVTRFVESFTGFTLFLFLIELVILLAASGSDFFSQAGYVLDLTIVSTSLVVEMYARTKVVRLTGVLRVWRVWRFVRQLVDQERAAHETTRQVLERKELKVLHVEMQKDAAHESLKREYESRAGLETLLRSYKEEIVTLKEALQIAAQAVAEATVDHAYINTTNSLSRSAKHEYSEATFQCEEATTEDSTDQWEGSDVFDRNEAEGLSTERPRVEEEDGRKLDSTAMNSIAMQLDAEAARSEMDFQDALDG